MKVISNDELKSKLIQQIPLIDVRAPIEFNQGSIPGSVNIPILSDDERHLVGLCYKENGAAAAILLGHEIVQAENLKAKLQSWSTFLKNNPSSYLTCFRGGLRSQSAQIFLSQQGIESARLQDGYKAARQMLIDFLNSEASKFPKVILSGTTGCGKTHLLNSVSSFYPTIDLEGLAHHRGSAFGAWDLPQPAQADFENRLSVNCMRLMEMSSSKKAVLIEDESRMIGTCHIPEPFFLSMREAPVILVLESIQTRIENIFSDYIATKLIADRTSLSKANALFAKYKNSVLKIQKKLGGLRAQELLNELSLCEKDYFENADLERNKIWIEKLLVWYYDPMYNGSLDKRKPTIEFQGASQEISAYLKSKTSKDSE